MLYPLRFLVLVPDSLSCDARHDDALSFLRSARVYPLSCQHVRRLWQSGEHIPLISFFIIDSRPDPADVPHPTQPAAGMLSTRGMLPQTPLLDRVGILARDPGVLEKVTYEVSEPGALTPKHHDQSSSRSTGRSSSGGPRKWVVRCPTECPVDEDCLESIIPPLGAELQHVEFGHCCGVGKLDEETVNSVKSGSSYVVES